MKHLQSILGTVIHVHCQHLSAIIFAILALAPTINANSKIAMKNASDISVNDKYHYDFELQVANKLICLEILQADFSEFTAVSILVNSEGTFCSFVKTYDNEKVVSSKILIEEHAPCITWIQTAQIALCKLAKSAAVILIANMGINVLTTNARTSREFCNMCRDEPSRE